MEGFLGISFEPTRSSSRKKAPLTVKVGKREKEKKDRRNDFVGSDRGVDRRVLRVVSIGVKKIGERGEKTQKRDVLQNTERQTRSEQVDEGRKGTNARSNLLGDGRGG